MNQNDHRNHRSFMDDLRDFFQLAWRSFGVKLVVALGFCGGVATLVASLVVPLVTPQVVMAVRWTLAIGVVGVVGATLVLGVLGAMRESREATQEALDAWQQVRGLQAEKDKLLDDRASHMLAHVTNAALYGVVYYEDKVECDLAANGSMIVNHGFQLAATQEAVNGVQHFTWLPITRQEGKEIELEAPAKRLGRARFQVEWSTEVVSHQNGGLVKRFRAVPSLPLGKRFEYSWEERLPKGAFAMNLEEMDDAGREWEYYFHRIGYPTEKLDFSVLLPQGFKPVRVEHDAWYARHTYLRHMREQARVLKHAVRDQWISGRFRLRIVVENPLLGITYVLKWKPPVVFARVDV